MDLNSPLWFKEIPDKTEHKIRISNVIEIKQYLLRIHKVLQRKDFKFKEETFTVAKIVLNTLKSIINFHCAYVVGNPISINGNKEMVKVLNSVYKKGCYNKVDYEIVTDLYKYGNAFEYCYIDNSNVLRSKVIANEDSFPVYDENYNYVAFLEHWEDANTIHDIVYYPDKVETYQDNILTDTKINLSGLPIHYAAMDKSAYNYYGDSFLNDLIPIMNKIEELLSKCFDACECLSLSPIGVLSGQRLDSSIPKDVVGSVISCEDGGSFQYASAMLDHASIKLLLDNLIQELFTIACIPSSVVGQSNISNVSSISLQLLLNNTDNKAKQTVQVLKQGFFKRFDYMRKLLEKNGITFSDEDFDTLDFEFSLNKPIDTQSMLKELKLQYSMGAISKRTIIEKSPYSVNVAAELERIELEKGNPLK